MKHLFEALYKSEINLHISWFWDAGFDVKIGDEMNGYLASFSSYDLFEIEKWIEQKAKELFPDSKFSKTYKMEIKGGIQKKQHFKNRNMSKLKTQFGTAVTTDFEENTWTFEMDKNFKVTAGEFAILPKEKYDALLVALKGIRNSMNVHPDCEENSEFEDMVSRCDDALSDVV